MGEDWPPEVVFGYISCIDRAQNVIFAVQIEYNPSSSFWVQNLDWNEGWRNRPLISAPFSFFLSLSHSLCTLSVSACLSRSLPMILERWIIQHCICRKVESMDKNVGTRDFSLYFPFLPLLTFCVENYEYATVGRNIYVTRNLCWLYSFLLFSFLFQCQ